MGTPCLSQLGVLPVNPGTRQLLPAPPASASFSLASLRLQRSMHSGHGGPRSAQLTIITAKFHLQWLLFQSSAQVEDWTHFPG